VPEHLQDGLIEYIAARRPCGQFLTAVLSNDLKDTCAYADEISIYALRHIMVFLFTYAPGKCWGSPDLVAVWLADDAPCVVQSGRADHPMQEMRAADHRNRGEGCLISHWASSNC
jgi:hypothetical protein